MAKYMVMVETLGANPTHSKGDIIEDSGDQKSLYDIPHLLRIGAIEKLGADGQPAKAEQPAENDGSSQAPDMVVAPGEQMPKDDDDKAQHRASRR